MEPEAGKANWNIFAMVREGLNFELTGAFQKALLKNEAVTLNNAIVKTNGETQAVEVVVQPLEEPDELRGMVMIIFTEKSKPHEVNKANITRRSTGHSDRVTELERELHHVWQELKNSREELQAFQEQLSSANEELQSTNKELQSANEELTTSKDELQSSNEELQTINHELQTKADELSQTNNDMKNLLESTDIATLFLDNALRVRRFAARTAKTIKLIPADQGRLITDIVFDLAYPELAEDAREVLRTLSFTEKSVSAGDGRWFAVRIMPYRTLENKIDGLVITFTEITASKELEAALRQTQADLEKHIEKQDRELNKAAKRLQSKKQQHDQDKDADTTPEFDETREDSA